jgi:hypothetical protein
MNTRARAHADPPPCPQGGPAHGPPETCVRHGKVDYADVYPALRFKRGTVTGIADVGWECRSCGHEWGFEVLTDGYLSAVELLTGGRTTDHQERAIAIMTAVDLAGREAIRRVR